jgi:hypothetical protein
VDDVRRSQSHTAPPQYKPSENTSICTLFFHSPKFQISSFSNNYLARVNHKNQSKPHESVAARSWRRDVASSGGGGRGCPCPAITRKQPSLLGQHSYIGTTPTLQFLLSVGDMCTPSTQCVRALRHVVERRDMVCMATGVKGPTPCMSFLPSRHRISTPWPWALLCCGHASVRGDACGWLYEF